MNTMLSNFVAMFRKFPSAHLLNIFGLSVAFAAFYIIMAQVNYDYSYNKEITDYDRIYRYEHAWENDDSGNAGDYKLYMSRPLGEIIAACSPHIESYGLMSYNPIGAKMYVDENGFDVTLRLGVNDYLQVFQPKMLAGSTDALVGNSFNLLIPASWAMKFFGTTDAVGKTLRRESNNRDYTIAGVFEDYSENSFLHDCLFFGGDRSKDEWFQQNYQLYLRLDDKASLDETLAAMKAEVKQVYYINRGNTLQSDEICNLVPLYDTHFEKVPNTATANKGTTYLLFCFSLLIIIVAGVNFMNFTLAQTPMRLRSINTQKVLGANNLKLRGMLLGESIGISVLGFFVSLALVYVAQQLGIQQMVESDLSFSNHLVLLLVLLLISVVIGVLSGLYPSWYVTSFPPALVLKGNFGLSPQGKQLRTALVGFQFVVAFVLVIGIVVIYLQSLLIKTADYGYEKEEIVAGYVSPEVYQSPDAAIAEVLRVPGVVGAAYSEFLLNTREQYKGQGRNDEEHQVNFQCIGVDWNYLDVMGISIKEGRSFRETDKNVYVVNEVAKQMYPWIEIDKPVVQGHEVVVGVCENVRFGSFRSDDMARPLFFAFYDYDSDDAFQHNSRNYINVRLASNTDKYEVIEQLQQTLEKFSPGYDFEFRPMDKVIEALYVKEKKLTNQVTLLSLLALVISLIGVFGLTMFESEYRHKEIGIRKIFGSSTAQILMMFNKRYLIILAICFILAAPIGYLTAMNWLQSFATKTVISPLVYICSFLSVSLMTVLTVTWQSWKNASENPVNSIKTE